MFDARHGREQKSQSPARHAAARARKPRRTGQRAPDERGVERPFFPNKISNGISPPICGSRCRARRTTIPLRRWRAISSSTIPADQISVADHFPPDVDVNPKINSLAGFKCDDGWGKAHVVVNREGGMLLDHELSVPWRETKFERAVNFGGAMKGLFLHVEMIQPRRSTGRRGNDAQPPDPSFTTAQYDRLALIYTIASVRAGRWLVPAFHAAIDAHIRNGHDDPLNFDVQSFAESLDRVTQQLQGPKAAPPEAVAQGETDTTPAPDASAVPSEKPAETGRSVAASVDGEAPAQPSGSTLESEPMIGGTAEAGIELKSRKPQSVSANHCTTAVAEGRRRGLCRPHVAETRWRGKHAHLVRAVDRRATEDSRGAGRNAGDVHPHHVRGAPRHSRA